MVNWDEAFQRLERGESYQKAADALGVAVGTLYRRHIQWLESQVVGKRRELVQLRGATESLDREFQRKKAALVAAFGKDEQELKSRLQSLKEKLTSLSAEYVRKRISEEQKLAEVLGGAQEELAKTQSQVTELKKAVVQHGLGLDEALILLSKIKNLSDEVHDLSNQKGSLSNEVARGRKTISRLKAEKSDLGGTIKLRGSYLGQLQQQTSSLIYAHNQLLVSRDNLRAWWGGEGLQLTRMKGELESQVEKLAKRVEELSREIGAKEKVNGMLNAALEKTRVDLNETVEKLELSRVQVQAILTSASLQAEEILKSSKAQSEEILAGLITKKGEVSKLEGEIAELESDYERKVKVVERRLSEIKEAWVQMTREAGAKGAALPSIGF